MLSRDDLVAYDRDLGDIEGRAEEAAMRAYDAMRASDLNASVAEVREGVKDIVDGTLSSYGDTACERACELYEVLGGKTAEIPEVDDETRSAIDRQARFYVGVIVQDGDREDI